MSLSNSTHHKRTGNDSLAIAFAFVWLVGCDSAEIESGAVGIDQQRPTSDVAIRSFCGDCHLLPAPHSFAKSRWREEVEQGFRLYAKSGRGDLIKPDFDATLAFFAEAAPEALTFAATGSTPDRLFERADVPWGNENQPVAISHVCVLSGDGEPLRLAMSDLWSGRLYTFSPASEGSPAGAGIDHQVVGRVAHPAQVQQVDFLGTGVNDFVVADLGPLNPEDADQASLWLLQSAGDQSYRRRPLKLGLARVSCVRPLDHDGDGDIDLLVGDFGMHFVGSIFLLTNQGIQHGLPQFEWSVLDDRPGAIDTPIVDMNGDGRPDIVTLVSQHHEMINLLLNQGDGKFQSQLIYQAPDPSYGSSGIEIVDFDRDGDLDVIYTNGDTFDDSLAKPYHAIHWLENQGAYPFVHHAIAAMPGVYCATTGDIDLDGDLDIAAVALLGEQEVSKQPTGTFDGVIWLEQTEAGKFRRHAIVTDTCNAATCRLLDWDEDGDLDLLVPPHRFDRAASSTLTVYLNSTR